MKPFEIPSGLESIVETYPSVSSIVDAIKDGDKDTRDALARLWLSEGIPYCFKIQPAIYESFRLWLSRQLQVQAKEITLIGSARQGFSLSPGENLGRPFGDYSDLDLSIISPSLFEQMKKVFSLWLTDYRTRKVSPRNAKENKYWEDNAKRVPLNLRRGFIDPHKIPTWERYPEARAIGQTKYEAHEKLKVTPGAPIARRISVRVYRDWDSFIRQMAINLKQIGRS